MSLFVLECMGSLPEFEKRINLSFGIKRLLNKINEYELEKRLKTIGTLRKVNRSNMIKFIRRYSKNVPRSLQYPCLSFFGNQLSKEKSLTYGSIQILALSSRKDTEPSAPTIDQFPWLLLFWKNHKKELLRYLKKAWVYLVLAASTGEMHLC